MPETDHRLDDKYTDGIWYDTMNGDFCTIESPDGEQVILRTPDGDPFYEMPVSEWLDEQSDFRKVSDEAVEDPVSVVNRAVRILSRNDINELASVLFQEEIDLRYARQQVEIREQSEEELLSDFYDEIRESVRVAMKAEGVDEGTVGRVLRTVDDNV